MKQEAAHAWSFLAVLFITAFVHTTVMVDDGVLHVVGHAAKDGMFYIDVETPQFEGYKLGNVVQVQIPVRSDWHEPIPGVRAQIDIYAGTKRVHRFTSLSTIVPARQDATIFANWNTQDMQPGTYTMRTTVQYAGEVTIIDRELKLTTENIKAHRTLTAADWIQIIFATLLTLTVLVAIATRLIRKPKEDTTG